MGSQCLVPWECVCSLKEDGGLGVKRLDTQNVALLLKLIHRLHHLGDSAWARWVASQVQLADLSGSMAGAHWSDLRQLLPAYRKMTTVTIGDGKSTDFWQDTWLLDAPLADCLPALFSHRAGNATTVHDVVSAGLRTPQATTELEELRQLLLCVNLSSTPDERHCSFKDAGHRLWSGLIYRASMRGDQTCASHAFVWGNFAPPRVKFYGCMASRQGSNPMQGQPQAETHPSRRRLRHMRGC